MNSRPSALATAHKRNQIGRITTFLLRAFHVIENSVYVLPNVDNASNVTQLFCMIVYTVNKASSIGLVGRAPSNFASLAMALDRTVADYYIMTM